MKALVLSGGTGTRLRPLTHTGAKQLLPVANKPILFYVIEKLKACHIENIGVIISPETGREVRKALGDGSRFGVQFHFLEQDAPRGLAHTVQVAEDFLANDPFVMYLGDNLIGSPISRFVERFQQRKSDAHVLLKGVENPSAFGVAETDEEGNVKRLVEKPKVPPSNLALVGLYIFSPEIHKATRAIKPSWRNELEITDAIQWLVDHQRPVTSEILESWWLDTGKKDDILAANTAVLDDWIQRQIDGEVDSLSQVNGRVQLGKGSKVINSTLRGPIVIGEGVTVENSFIGPFTSIGNQSRIIDATIQHCVLLEECQVVGINRLEDSICGRKSIVRAAGNKSNGHRLLIGDDSVVEVK
ncbi:MAG: glucose-1-phosphate thymidylyltransferase [Deltaproteobacteria bacterium]|nr:glucose-1-phosphate thymidylyltransferase [Deltaproteobacteria bacterium]